MLRIQRNILPSELQEFQAYRLYIKRHAMTDGFSFEVTSYGFNNPIPEFYKIERLTVTNNSFAIFIQNKTELQQYEQILWEQIYKDIKKDLKSMEERHKILTFKVNFNLINETIIEREKTVLREIGKLLRKQKLKRILK